MGSLLEFLKTNRQILATAGFCLFLCAGFVDLSEFLWVSGQLFGDNISFELVVFSGFFYFQCSIGDLNESMAEYRYYEKLRTPSMRGSVKRYDEAFRRKASVRAFQGVSPAMWRGIGDKVAGWPEEAGPPPAEKLLEASRIPLNEVISFNHQAKVPVFLDCLYFSEVTITSTGFGDIIPQGRFSKILVVIESISGVLLVAIGIAIALGGLGSGTSSAAAPPNGHEEGESR